MLAAAIPGNTRSFKLPGYDANVDFTRRLRNLAGGNIIAHCLLFVDANVAGVGSDKALIKDAARQLAKLLFFQRAQITGAYLGGDGNFFQRDTAQFTLSPQFFAKLTHGRPLAGGCSCRIIVLPCAQVKLEIGPGT